MRLLLDTAVLGEVCHPRKYVEVRTWLARVVAHHDVLISEVADYELRRELLRIGSHRSLDHLDELTRELTKFRWRRRRGAQLRNCRQRFDAVGQSRQRQARWMATS